MASNAELRYLIDTYLDWTKRQQVPIVEEFAVDLNTVETSPWALLGGQCRAAFIQLRGRGDFVGLHLIEIPPGGHTDWQRHLYDEFFYVLSGHGSTIIEAGKDQKHSFEWGPRAVFAPPLNAPYRLFNVSGSEPVRLISANDMPFMLNVFRNESFLFDNPFRFPERLGRTGYFAGEGDFLPIKPGKHMWETNFIPDLAALSLPEWEARGAGSRNVKLILSDSSLHAHSSEIPVGSYKKGHRHAAGAHVFAVTGSGYTLLWYEGDKEFERHEWRHGFVFAPPDGMFHQHFNTSPDPARYLAVSLGSHRYPVLTHKVKLKQAPDADVRDGGLQIDYKDQDPRIHAIWRREMAAAGVASQMGKYFAEDRGSDGDRVVTDAEAKFLLDPYLDWTRKEGPPIHEDFGVDLLTAETGPWPRLGDRCNAAFVHLKGRGDWTTVFLLEVPPGGKSAPQQHLFDELFYVISGSGSVTVELPDGGKHSFEWGPRSMFAPPLNARYQIFNSSGLEPVRLASANDMRILMNMFHNEAFLFDNPFGFPERAGLPSYYAGEGEMTSIRPGRNLWETNFVPDLGAFELRPWEARGAGSSNIQFLMSEGSMGAHASEMPVGCYKKGHRHGPGLHIFPIHGSGYTLFWYEGDRDFQRVDWRHGMIYAPPDNMFHQHFNTSPRPARYLAVGFGTKRYPIVLERRIGSEGRRTDVSVKEGGSQIEYHDQDPRIHALWLEELRKTGVRSEMGKYFEETEPVAG